MLTRLLLTHHRQNDDVAELISDVGELVELSGTWLQPWVDGRRDHFVRIHAEKVTGRRLYDQPAT